MDKSYLTLLSPPGKLTDTLLDVLRSEYDLTTIYWDGSDIDSILHALKDCIHNTQVCIINFSYVLENSSEIFKKIYRLYPEKPYIICHRYPGKTYAKAFINMGANGYVAADFKKEELTAAVVAALYSNTSKE